jgi:hypothetical protein
MDTLTLVPFALPSATDGSANAVMSLSILDALKYARELRLAEVDALPQGVQTWMVFMRSLFLSSVFFAIWKKEARVILAMVVSNAILLFGYKAIFPEVHSGDIGRTIHLFLWTAVLYYLARQRREIFTDVRSGTVLTKIFGLWIFAVTMVLTISLVFDFSAAIGNLLSGS